MNQLTAHHYNDLWPFVGVEKNLKLCPRLIPSHSQLISSGSWPAAVLSLSWAAAPRWSGWPPGPAAAGPRRRWSRRRGTAAPSSPRGPPTGHAASGRRSRWPSLCHSPGTHPAWGAEELCGSGSAPRCCCGSAVPPGCGSRRGSGGWERVLEGAGSCPCLLWGSRRGESPVLPLLHCHGHCQGHTWGWGREEGKIYHIYTMVRYLRYLKSRYCANFTPGLLQVPQFPVRVC